MIRSLVRAMITLAVVPACLVSAVRHAESSPLLNGAASVLSRASDGKEMSAQDRGPVVLAQFQPNNRRRNLAVRPRNPAAQAAQQARQNLRRANQATANRIRAAGQRAAQTARQSTPRLTARQRQSIIAAQRKISKGHSRPSNSASSNARGFAARTARHAAAAAQQAAVRRAQQEAAARSHSNKSDKGNRHQNHTRPYVDARERNRLEEARRQRDALKDEQIRQLDEQIRQQEAAIRAAQERDKARKLAEAKERERQQAEELARQQAEKDKLEAQKVAEDARRRRQQIADFLSEPQKPETPTTTAPTSVPPINDRDNTQSQKAPPQVEVTTTDDLLRGRDPQELKAASDQLDKDKAAAAAEDKKNLSNPDNEDRKLAAGGADRGQKFLSGVKNIAELAGDTPTKNMMDGPNTLAKGLVQGHNVISNIQKDERVAAGLSSGRMLVAGMKAPGVDGGLSTLESVNKARRAYEEKDYAGAVGGASSALSKSAAGIAGGLVGGPKGADMAVSLVSTIETFGGDIVVANEEQRYRDRAKERQGEKWQERIARAKLEHRIQQPFKNTLDNILDKNPGLAEKLQIKPQPVPDWHKEPPDHGSLRPRPGRWY